jgi:peptide-methionine (R)-S-oxide reductase
VRLLRPSALDSRAKFDFGTGWPSFWRPITEDNVSLHADHGWLGSRTKVTCSRKEGAAGGAGKEG